MNAAESTQALIVGISRFSFPNSDLRSPVPDALQFAAWLVRRKVPLKNIRLFLSPTDKADCDAGVAKLSSELTYERATSANVSQYLDNLPIVGDTLLIYWSGHGVVDKGNNRFLFFEDTTEGTLHLNLDVRNTFNYLRSKKLGIQIGYFDACAKSFKADLGGTMRVEQDGPARQSFFFAASPGQAAAESKTTGVSAFSKQLFEVLENEALPLNETRVIDEILRRFKKDSSQRPQYFASKTPDSDEYIVGVRPSSVYVQTVADRKNAPLEGLRKLANLAARGAKLQQKAVRDQLFQELQAAVMVNLARPDYAILDPEEDLLQMIAGAMDRGIVPRLCDSLNQLDAESLPVREVLEKLPRLESAIELTKGIPVQTARQVFHRFREATARGIEYHSISWMIWNLAESAGLEGVAEFLVHLSAMINEPLARTGMQDWARPVLLDRLAAVTAEAEETPAYLFIDIRRDATALAGKCDTIKACLRRGARTLYRYGSDNATKSEELSSIIDKITLDAEHVNKQFFVQFLVPFEMFDWEPHTIPLDGDPMGTYFPVALRWRERFYEKPRTNYADWIKATEEIYNHIEKGCHGCRWFDPQTNLLSAGDPGLIAFVKPQPELVRKRVKTGAPFVAWPVAEPADQDVIRGDLNAITARAVRFDELPVVLRDERQKGVAPDINLLWDDAREFRAWRFVEP